MKLELDMAEFIDGQKKKAHKQRLKMKKIKRYAHCKENSLHYALAAVQILLGVTSTFKFIQVQVVDLCVMCWKFRRTVSTYCI